MNMQNKYKYIFKTLFSVLLGIYPEVKLLDDMVIMFLTFWATTMLFSIVAAFLYLHRWCIRVPICPQPCKNLLSVFFIVAILMGMRWYLIVVLICISLMISGVEHFFMHLLAFCMSSLEKCLFKPVVHFLTIFVVVEFQDFSIYFGFDSLIRYMPYIYKTMQGGKPKYKHWY